MRNIFLFLFIFLSTNSFALESSDTLKTQILKIYDRNVLVINRGLEDAIFKADHGKITSDDGFIARGICIKTTMLTSHWKIYRVVRPQLISKDSEYTLRSINQSEIPPSLIRYSKVDFSEFYNDISDNDRKKQVDLQQDRVVNFDLPNDITETAAYKRKKKTDFDNFVERNFSDQKLKDDLESTSLEIFASPLSWQTRYQQKEIHYGVSIFNIGLKYQFSLNAIETQRKIKDPVSGRGYDSKSTHYDANFQFNHLTEKLSLISFIEYDKEKIGDIYYPYEHYQLGFLGFKFHLIENDPRSSLFDISYTPTFENIKFTNPYVTNFELFEREGVRHRFKIRMYGNLSPDFSNKTEVIYAPITEFSSSNFNYEDTYVHVSSLFSYKMGKNFYWDYLLEYERDELQGEVYQIRADNTIQTVRIRYLVDL